jgi:hypothetical protein
MTGDDYFAGVADCWDRKLLDGVNRLRLSCWYVGWKWWDMRRKVREFGLGWALRKYLVGRGGRVT